MKVDNLDRWFVSRARWERGLLLACFIWSVVIFFLFVIDSPANYKSAILVGPGWAIALYFVVRMISLMFHKIDGS
jgi:predicted membrane protein